MSRHRAEKTLAWRATIDAWKRSGQTANAFCRARRLTRSNFDRWRRILAAEPGPSPPPASPAFVPVHIVADPINPGQRSQGAPALVVPVPVRAAEEEPVVAGFRFPSILLIS